MCRNYRNRLVEPPDVNRLNGPFKGWPVERGIRQRRPGLRLGRRHQSSVNVVSTQEFQLRTPMKPNISEFSYGYAVTDELIHWYGFPITAAPVFPSLYREGQLGGGYDVKLPLFGVPLFLQFKLSDHMVRGSAREAHAGRLPVPYYRMHLRPRRHSAQHQMLLDLENSGGEAVYYVAPAFHQSSELNNAYRHHEIGIRSIWMRPSYIGDFPDDDDHYVAFNDPWQAPVFCSEPREIDAPVDFDSFSKNITAQLTRRGEIALQEENLHRLADTLRTIVGTNGEIPLLESPQRLDYMREGNPIAWIESCARIFFNAQFYVVRHQDTVA